MDRAIAITGVGMISAQGVGVEASWRGVVDGREVLRKWSGAPREEHPLAKVKVAECAPLGELPRPDDLPARLWRTLSRTQHLAVVAAEEALGQAGLPRKLRDMRAGLFLATTVCGMDQNEQYYAQYRVNPEKADPGLMHRLQPFEVAHLLARRHGIAESAPRPVFLTTCVGSALAIGAAMDAINLGECNVAIAGGSEALCRVVFSGFHSLKVAAPEGCRPFDLNRPGMTVGEGAGMLVLESLEHARKRGASVLGYLRGFGVSCDAHHITAPEPSGTKAARAIVDALRRAGIEPRQVGYVNAHGTGTRDNDAMEMAALRQAFATVPSVSSTKRCTGHTFGAAGAIEAIFCLQALRESVLPVNAGSQTADASLDLPVIRGASMRRQIDVALSTNFAFGGNNTALVLARAAEGPA